MLIYISRYTVIDDRDTSTFVVSMDLNVCLTAGADCAKIADILIDYRLPKPACNWDLAFKNPGMKFFVTFYNPF